MTNQPLTGRRRVLELVATLPVALRAGPLLAAPPPIAAAPFIDSPKLMVAGPADGALNRWADALLPALEQSLPKDTSIRRVEIGSADGVTGANQFEARGTPDGQTVLLAPGQAGLAWMVGDPRAQFDVARWVPVLAGTSSGIVVGRANSLAPDRAIRIAAAGPASPDLTALLGVDLLGLPMEPVFGLIEPSAAEDAFLRGRVDVLLLRGHRVPERFAPLAASGAKPLFTLGTLDDSGRPVRDEAFPAVPSFTELCATRTGRAPAGPLYDAWCAAAAAAQLEFGMVLPQLTPAAMVAVWRRAGLDAIGALGVQTTATSLGVRTLGGLAATASTAAIATTSLALQELRRWLVTRFNWRPA
jgi:hypothetical protein